MKRGEVWYADLPAPANPRPVLILSRDSLPPGRDEITVAYLTTRLRGTPAQVRLTPAEDGVWKVSEVNLDAINTIPKRLLLRRICQLSADRMLEVQTAIAHALDFV